MPRSTIGRVLPGVFGAATGGLTALLLALSGDQLLPSSVSDGAGVLGYVAVVAGLADVALLGNAVGVDRETVSRRSGWVSWSIKNSAEMSMMVVTRPGLMTMYVLVALLATSSPATAAVAGVVYGGVRSSGHVLLERAVRRDRGLALLRRRAHVRRGVGLVTLVGGALALSRRSSARLLLGMACAGLLLASGCADSDPASDVVDRGQQAGGPSRPGATCAASDVEAALVDFAEAVTRGDVGAAAALIATDASFLWFADLRLSEKAVTDPDLVARHLMDTIALDEEIEITEVTVLDVPAVSGEFNFRSRRGNSGARRDSGGKGVYDCGARAFVMLTLSA